MLTIYTSKIKTVGQTRGPFILIHPKHKHDKGLHEHERTHVRQWTVATVLSAAALLILVYATMDETWLPIVCASIAVHGVLYKLVPAYRLHCEIEAYREQASHYPDDRMPRFARFIANDYGLRISESEALELIRK